MATTETQTQTVRAQAKWVRTSARKARLVAEHIRGRPVPEARAVLAFTPRAAARDMEKVLRSAVANAESRPDLQWHGDELVVSAVWVDEGPTLKRWRARARGRVARIRKRTCHITLVLEQAPEPVGGARRGRRSSAAAATPQAEPKRRIPTPRRPAVRRPKQETAVEETEAVTAAETVTAAEAAPAEEPQAEAAKAETPQAEAPQTAEKPKRRSPVRRKKTTEDEGSK
jgi:large subunit ribosomal protein L22